MISQRNYEVGQDLLDRFRETDPGSDRFFKPAERRGHAMFDLPGYIVARLRRAGLTQVEELGLCTYADPAQFYSYRRSTHRTEPDYGRHINAIALAG
jgi:copper oxidase (laccase) domain-containing protein